MLTAVNIVLATLVAVMIFANFALIAVMLKIVSLLSSIMVADKTAQTSQTGKEQQ